jgi:glycoprotein-N-acetylgalactosamine 3-beta-galactosyltransferase
MVYTVESSHPTRLRAIRETWAGGCDGFLAFSTVSDPRIPAISIPHDGREEYENMWQKVRSIWKFVARHYLDDFDYYMLGGDDLYVLPENLRAYLTGRDPEDDFFAGRRFKQSAGVYFNSGGAGYVLSRGLLRKYATVGYDHDLCSPTRRTSMEDVMIANCLRRLFHVELVDTRDDTGRERFHPFAPGHHYTWRPPRKGGRDWYETYNEEWPVQLGEKCCAPDSVSFHYLKKPAMVRHIHSLFYFCNQ